MVTRLSGGLTPEDGSDPRTFPTIWNATADTVEALEAKNIPAFGTATTPISGDSFVYNGTSWQAGPRSNNAVINGNFSVWQRGTSFSSGLFVTAYTADRWQTIYNGTGATRTISRQAFSPGDIEPAGYSGAEYFLRYNQSVAGTGGTFHVFANPIEDVQTFAGQTVTMSFWAKSSTTSTITPGIKQTFGSGGSSQVFVSGAAVALTASWERYTASMFVPSISGKTVGGGSSLSAEFSLPVNSVFTVDLWGVQLEAGPVATPFKPAGGGSKAAELNLCHRYYFRVAPTSGGVIATGYNTSTTAAVFNVYFPQEMRFAPTAIDQSFWAPNYEIQHGNFTKTTASAYPAFISGSTTNATLTAEVASGLTAGQGSMLIGVNADGFVGWSAEL